MSGVSRFVRSHNGGSSKISLPVAKSLRFGTGSPLTRTTLPDTPDQAIEIDSDEERESSLLDSYLNNSTSKPAAMANRATKPTNNTRSGLKRKLNEYLKSSDTVEIFVGPKLEKWTLNEELLCDRIPYFKAAFKSGFKESKDKKLELPEDNPDVFGYLVDWLYMEKIVCTFCGKCFGTPSTEEKENPNHILQWAQLWVLADKLGCEELMNSAQLSFITCLGKVGFGVSPDVISFVFEKMPETCYLREFLSEHFVSSFFQSCSYPEAFGEAAAASKAFNAEFLKQIKAHVGEKKDDCYILRCTLHS